MWTLLEFFGCVIGGAKRDRTADLLVANEALSQLSYSPTRWEQPHYFSSEQSKCGKLAARGSDALHAILKPSEKRIQMGIGNLALRHAG
jgi:hypothetical protein